MKHKKIEINDLDEKYMKQAIKLAQKAASNGDVPIGCVIVYEGKVIARGYNRRNMDKTTLAHAEILAIKKASKVLEDWRLEECTMYVTLEPCQMCAGAIVNSRIRKVYIGAIEPIHVAFLRGRDLKRSLIYCTESQNFTIEQIKLLVGRIGEGSQLWLDGDFKAQVDKAAFEKDNNGLGHLVERLKGNKLFSIVDLQKSERSAASALCDLLD